MDKKELIRQAICAQRLLQFDYEGDSRTVEPHQLGFNQVGHLALSAYWVGGASHSAEKSSRWREYLVDGMSCVTVLSSGFSGPRPGYKRAPNGLFMSALAEL